MGDNTGDKGMKPAGSGKHVPYLLTLLLLAALYGHYLANPKWF